MEVLTFSSHKICI